MTAKNSNGNGPAPSEQDVKYHLIVRSFSKTRLRNLKKDFEEILLDTEVNTEASKKLIGYIDAIESELERRGVD